MYSRDSNKIAIKYGSQIQDFSSVFKMPKFSMHLFKYGQQVKT